jgi:hypothetical protein
MGTIANNTGTAVQRPVRHSRLATAAVVLSVFAFIPPLGIAALVLGHVSGRYIKASRGALNGAATALAALIIAYAQLLMVAVALIFVWPALRLTVDNFRRDSMVQRVLRTSDNNQVPDSVTAGEEAATARSLMIQLAGIEERYHRKTGQGYLCRIPDVVQASEGDEAAPAEKHAFADRLQQSRYIFEIQACTPEIVGDSPAKYKLTAVPRWPQMPDAHGTWCADAKGEFTLTCSPILCADETGVVRQTYGGTSADCFEHGHDIR